MSAFFGMDESLTVRLTLTLLHFLWQGCVAAVLASAAGWMLRRTSPHVRYVVDVAVLTLMVACLPLTFAAIAVPQAEAAGAIAEASVSESVGSSAAGDRRVATAAAAFGDSPIHHADRTIVADFLSSNNGRSMAIAIPPLAECLKPVAPYAAIAYLAGVAVMLFRLARAWARAQRWRTSSEPLIEPELLAMLGHQARQMGLRGAPPVAWCRGLLVPLVVGMLRPVILLPAAVVTSLAPAQIEALLAHELAHIRRHDLWINLFQRVAEALLFFHPAVWYVSRRISIERETACDDSVLAAGWRSTDYAETLLRMAELCLARHSSPADAAASLAAAGDSPTQFKLRVMRLLGAEAAPQPALPPRTGLVALVLGASVLLTPVLLRSRAASPSDPEAAILAVTTPGPEAPAAEVVRRLQGIRRAVSFLESQQQDDGSWRINGMPNWDQGGTALAAFALLKADRSIDDKSIQRAAEYLRDVRSSSTYTVSLQTLVFCQLDPRKYREQIDRNVKWLVDTQTIEGPAKGGWSYGPQRSARSDGSNTRFVAWAFDAAGRAGFDVPETTWRNLAEYWLASQLDDGSWGYTPAVDKGTATMTLAGIAGTSAAKSALDDAALHTRIDAAVQRAWKWHDASFTAADHLQRGTGFRFYALHCLSLAGLSSGHRGTGESDWFEEGARRLFEMQNGQTGQWTGQASEDSTIATSFALLFLQENSPVQPQRAAASRADASADDSAHVPGNAGGEAASFLEQPGVVARKDADQHVVSITVGDKATDRWLAGIKSLPHLKHLYIETTDGVTERGLEHIAEIRSLRGLEFYSVTLPDAGLAHLARLPQLNDLSIREAKLTDAALLHLGRLRDLETLRISGNRITDKGIQSLRELVHLEVLDLANSNWVESQMMITDAGLASLAAMTRLRELDLGGLAISDHGLGLLSGLRQLQSLNLRGTSISGEGLQQLTSFPNLESLQLGGPWITDEGMAYVAACAHLKQLTLAYTKIGDRGFRHIEKLRQLERLSLDSHFLTDDALACLASLPALKHIELRASGITDTALEHLSRIPSLTRLDLSGSGRPGVNVGRNFTAAGFAHLRAAPNLQTLYLTNTNVPWTALRDLKGLRALSLMMPSSMSPDDVRRLQQALPDTSVSATWGGASVAPMQLFDAEGKFIGPHWDADEKAHATKAAASLLESDTHGILRGPEGRPFGVWGVDGPMAVESR